MKNFMIILIFILISCTLFIALFINAAPFGNLPKADSLEKIKKSVNFKDGQFQNLSPTPQITGNKNMFQMLWEFQFHKSKRVRPKDTIPSLKTDLFALDRNEDILIWFGHSSLFIQLKGIRFLIDPVFDKPASPVSFYNRPFKGADQYKIEDIPEIDYLIISHDHWDHLDYKIALQLQDRLKKVICGLGVGAHFERWGYNKDKIIELDWYEENNLEEGFKIYCLPARHFSGRGLKRNTSLWASFLVETKDFKFYIGGDSGYDDFYKEIGEKFGGIDLAALDSGQYDKNWKYIHMMPEEAAQAAKDLKAKSFMPVHAAKYALSVHAWDDPFIRISKAMENSDIKLLTPIIGEKVQLQNKNQKFQNWWENIE
jgi:L-ascorbate metabolism protein UlaG (beta-lactamase superfamily)